MSQFFKFKQMKINGFKQGTTKYKISKSSILNKNEMPNAKNTLKIKTNFNNNAKKVSQDNKNIKNLIIHSDQQNINCTNTLETSTNNMLFNTIEKFHNVLCKMPLKSMITTQNWEQWLSEQNYTLNKLSSALKSQKKKQQYGYYYSKLESVGMILSNIKNNIIMLDKMNALSYNSNNSSAYMSKRSDQSENRVSKLQKYTQNTQQMLSCDNYEIMSGLKNEKNSFLKYENEEKYNQMKIKPCKNQQQFFQNNNKNEILNYPKVTEFPLDKTKVKYVSNELYEITKQPPIYSHKSTINLNQNKIQYSNDNHIETSTSAFIKQYAQNQISLMEIIKQIRIELNEKDQAIQQLLITQQAYEQQQQIQKKVQKRKDEQLIHMTEEIKRSNIKMKMIQQQLKQQKQRLKNYQEELEHNLSEMMSQQESKRQNTIHQRQKFKKQQEVLRQQILRITNLLQKSQQTTIMYKNQIKTLQKQKRIVHEKGQIYRHKYYQLINKNQSISQQKDNKQNSNRNKFEQKRFQLHQIINQHRQQLTNAQ